MFGRLQLLLPFLHFLTSVVLCFETYYEDLDITTLPSKKVHTLFKFRSLSDQVNSQHFDLLPRPLVTILLTYQVEELHLTLTQGLWRDGIWGYSPHSAPPGGQFQVWFGGDVGDVERRWKHVRNSVSGITCASLGALSSEDTISPKMSLKPTGLTSTGGDNRYMRYGVSPCEVVCTENLTPWLKLLPCASRSGLASLLEAGRLYDTAYHSLAVHVRRVEYEGSVVWEISLSLSLVFSPPGKDWSFKTMFGRTLVNSCPVASATRVRVKTLEAIENIDISPVDYTPMSDQEVLFDARNITKNKILNVYLRYKSAAVSHVADKTPPVQAHTYISRVSSSSSGHLVTIFTNSDHVTTKVLYLQTIPWYLRTYIHTLKVEQISPTTALLQPGDLSVQLANDRASPYTIETILSLPPNSVVKFSVQFDPLLLRWNEYPPDAHHGRNIPSGIVSFRAGGEVVRVYTESPLVYLPTPDFSMPFNVLCLVSTVIAIVYGSLFSLTTQELVRIKETDVKQGLLLQLISGIRGALRKTPVEKGAGAPAAGEPVAEKAAAVKVAAGEVMVGEGAASKVAAAEVGAGNAPADKKGG